MVFGKTVGGIKLEENMDLEMEVRPGNRAKKVVLWIVGLLAALIVLGYLFFYYALAFAGFVLLIVMWRKQQWKEIDTQLPKGTAFKTVYLNAGMILYVLICVATTVLALL